MILTHGLWRYDSTYGQLKKRRYIYLHSLELLDLTKACENRIIIMLSKIFHSELLARLEWNRSISERQWLILTNTLPLNNLSVFNCFTPFCKSPSKYDFNSIELKLFSNAGYFLQLLVLPVFSYLKLSLPDKFESYYNRGRVLGRSKLWICWWMAWESP